MKLINITNRLVHEVTNSLIMDDQSKAIVTKLIGVMGPSYTEFIHYAISKCSSNYIPVNSGNCPLPREEVESLFRSLSRAPVQIETSDILVADRMDLLYATDPNCYAEFTKFNSMFYGTIEEQFFGEEEFLNSELFLSVIRDLERIVSVIEQMMILSITEELLEDTIVVMLTRPNPDLLVLIY